MIRLVSTARAEGVTIAVPAVVTLTVDVNAWAELHDVRPGDGVPLADAVARNVADWWKQLERPADLAPGLDGVCTAIRIAAAG